MKQKRLFDSIISRFTFTAKLNKIRTHKDRNKSIPSKMLRFESLEERQLLSVTTAEYEDIQTTFDSLELNDYSTVNIIEIENTSLTSSSLKEAIFQAKATEMDDVIILRTSSENNTIDLQGEPVQIDIDSSTQGSISIIGYGDSILRLVNNDLNVIHVESGKVNFGGLNLTTRSDSTQLKNVLLTEGNNAPILQRSEYFSHPIIQRLQAQ